MTRYKVVEVGTVTNEELELAINAAVADGWLFDRVQFVVRESSRRPAMAFVFFTREENA